MHIRVLIIAVALVAFLAGCATIAPSALDIEERKAEIQIKAKELKPWVNSAKSVPACQAAFTKLTERERVLDNALLTAALHGESGQREVYSILGKKLKLLERLEKDIDSCIKRS